MHNDEKRAHHIHFSPNAAVANKLKHQEAFLMTLVDSSGWLRHQRPLNSRNALDAKR
jgi:hypothetical protein